MEEPLRFTGGNPPPSLWTQFPNWENTYDDEPLLDEDDALRPSENQRTVDEDVSFTAADAFFANGQVVPALLSVVTGEVAGIDVYPGPSQDETWSLSFDARSGEWIAMNKAWFLEMEGVLPVPVDDKNVFPMRVSSRLLFERTNRRVFLEIERPRVG